jgi:histone acetyltransferase (RNA polymerase elongator complex component)
MIYPIFLPHAGCPFQCVYCNQRVVVSTVCGENDILKLVEHWAAAHSSQVRSTGRPGEIAFFGGTFTALPHELIESILATVSAHVKQGTFIGIRFSTRPDCFEDRVLELLSKYPVRTVELGAQSLSDYVLRRSGRGYRASSVEEASKLVKDAGWMLGIQLMAGLPGDNRGLFLDSIRKAIELRPDFMRIYPTLVLEGTPLAESFRGGVFAALSLDEALDWLAAAYDLTIQSGIRIIRMGLHPDPALEKPGVILAGPHHPAFGYLVKCRWWRDRVDRRFASAPELLGSEIDLFVAPNLVGDVVGHRKANLGHWKRRWGIDVKVAGNAGMAGVEMMVDKRRNNSF